MKKNSIDIIRIYSSDPNSQRLTTALVISQFWLLISIIIWVKKIEFKKCIKTEPMTFDMYKYVMVQKSNYCDEIGTSITHHRFLNQIPTLISITLTKMLIELQVRRQSFIEMQIFSQRWNDAVKNDKCWIDLYKQTNQQSNAWINFELHIDHTMRDCHRKLQNYTYSCAEQSTTDTLYKCTRIHFCIAPAFRLSWVMPLCLYI